VAVDMFPHTSHTELVILFERETKATSTPTTTATEAVTTETTAETEAEKTVECNESVAAATT